MVTAKKSSAAKTGTATTAVSPKPKTAAKRALAVSATETSAVLGAAVKKAPVKKSVTAKTSATTAATLPAVSAEQRHNYIEVAAFYVAQRRGFAPGNPADDWAMAEREVDRLIASGHFSR